MGERPPEYPVFAPKVKKIPAGGNRRAGATLLPPIEDVEAAMLY
jgi:hypothetical protein